MDTLFTNMEEQKNLMTEGLAGNRILSLQPVLKLILCLKPWEGGKYLFS